MAKKTLNRIEEIFHAALKLPPSGRGAFVDDRCGGDAELRREVESLRGFESENTAFLDRGPEQFAAEFLEESGPPKGLIGRVIGNYEILSLLGEGGMGSVYLAKDAKLLRQIALKVLPEQTVADENRVQRFVHEARAASALNHPNIPTIYDVGHENDLHFIAMEFVAGRTLHELVHDRAANLSQLLGYLIQTADGLAKAHAAGIVHRDLKPDNIRVSTHGYAIIYQGKYDEAAEFARLSLEGAIRTNAVGEIACAWRTLAMMGGKSAETVSFADEELSPEQCFERSRKILSDAQHKPELARKLEEFARFQRERGRISEADSLDAAAGVLHARLGIKRRLES